MDQFIFTKNLLLLTMLLYSLFNYSQINDTIGDLSIFAEPSKDELILWKEFDIFLLEWEIVWVWSNHQINQVWEMQIAETKKHAEDKSNNAGEGGVGGGGLHLTQRAK